MSYDTSSLIVAGIAWAGTTRRGTGVDLQGAALEIAVREPVPGRRVAA